MCSFVQCVFYLTSWSIKVSSYDLNVNVILVASIRDVFEPMLRHVRSGLTTNARTNILLDVSVTAVMGLLGQFQALGLS